MTTFLNPAHRALGFAAIILAAAACDSTSTAPKPAHPVAFQLAARASTGTLTASTGALQVTSLRVVVGAASLGSGDQFGCVNCQDNGGSEGAKEGVDPQQLLNVPLNGGSVLVATEPATAGRYSQAEISIESPEGATLAGTFGWPAGTSMEISGQLNGKPFTLPLAVTGSFRQTLTPPVDVTAGAATAIPVTITLPVASWFSANGVTLDPSIPAQRGQIEANARASLDMTEATPESKGTEP